MEINNGPEYNGGPAFDNRPCAIPGINQHVIRIYQGALSIKRPPDPKGTVDFHYRRHVGVRLVVGGGLDLVRRNFDLHHRLAGVGR